MTERDYSKVTRPKRNSSKRSRPYGYNWETVYVVHGPSKAFKEALAKAQAKQGKEGEKQ